METIREIEFEDMYYEEYLSKIVASANQYDTIQFEPESLNDQVEVILYALKEQIAG